MTSYEETLIAASKAGSSKASDAGVMAQFCATSLQLLVGAASPQLVWEGAQKKRMSASELVEMATRNPTAVHDLMWL
jgi:hypothetical protein